MIKGSTASEDIYESGACMSRISTLTTKALKSCLFSFYQEGTQLEDQGNRHWTQWCNDLGFPSLQNCESKFLLFINCLVFCLFWVLGVKLKTSFLSGRHCAAELYPCPRFWYFVIIIVIDTCSYNWCPIHSMYRSQSKALYKAFTMDFG